MKLRLVKEPFDDPDYLIELKHDGWRAIAYVENGQCKLISRNLRNLRFESLQLALAKMLVRDAILDGEIVCLDGSGVSHFNSLLSTKGRNVAAFYAFDLLWLDGTDLRELPLIVRKERLCTLVRSAGCHRLLYAQHVEGAGKQFFEEICRRDLEGIVAKHKTGIYREDRDDWIKVKNKTYSQAEGRHELFEQRRGTRG